MELLSFLKITKEGTRCIYCDCDSHLHHHPISPEGQEVGL